MALSRQGCAGPNWLPYDHGSLSLSSTSGARSARNLTPVGDLLRDQQPELIISRQKLEQARGIELVRIRREQQNQDLCFSSRPFVLCGLPVRRLPKTRCCMSGGRVNLSFRSPGIPNSEFRSARIALFRSFSQLLPSSRRAERFDSELRLRC